MKCEMSGCNNRVRHYCQVCGKGICNKHSRDGECAASVLVEVPRSYLKLSFFPRAEYVKYKRHSR